MLSRANYRAFHKQRVSRESPSRRTPGSRFPRGASYALCVLLLLLAVPWVFSSNAEKPDNAEETPVTAENTGVAVEIDGRPILIVYARIGGFTPEERAEAIQQRIVSVGKNHRIPTESIHAENRGPWTEILAGSDRIMAITDADANEADRARNDLASEYTEIIRQVVKQYREDHTLRRVAWGTVYAVLATIAWLLLILGLFRLRKKLRTSLEARIHRGEVGPPVHALGAWIGHYLEQPVLVLSRLAFWVIVLVLLQAYGTVVLRFFPATKYTSYQVTNWLLSELAGFGKTIVDYVPNLILLAFVCLMTSFLINVNRYFFGELRDGKLSIRGFYPDWAEPTAKLVRVLILSAAVIVAFPYLPGSQSPAFKGISVFVGVLLSLGSSSAVAHGVAGTILTLA